MQRPSLSRRFTWPAYEQAVLDVFREALRRLSARNTLKSTEDPINFEIHDLAVQVHTEIITTHPDLTFPFVIIFNGNNQPEPGDTIDSHRLSKRPDLTCSLKDELATDHRLSQIHYSLECKRLGAAVGNWVLNENYTKHGILRFRQQGHAYGKGRPSATMIGYVQNMEPTAILKELNAYARTRKVPSLKLAARAWVQQGLNDLKQRPLSRHLDADPIQLNHLWADLRHVTFVTPPPTQKTKKRPAKKKAKKPAAGVPPNP